MSKPATALLTLAMLVLVWPAGPAIARERVGETVGVRIESPHPYAPGDATRPVVWRHVLQHPGASFIKLHFAELDLGPGDVVELLDANGATAGRYTTQPGAPRSMWARAVPGDTAIIQLRSDGSGTGRGVAVDRYGHGVEAIVIALTCGTDQKQAAACFAGTPVGTASRAVGRMLFEQNGGLFACTGFLVSAHDHFVSNRHCISSQAAVNSLEVFFDFQRAECGGTSDLAPYESFEGDRLILTSQEQDLALMTLRGRPSATYGLLPLSDRPLAAGEDLYIPQHPFGDVKQVSVDGCRVSTPVADGASPASDFGHLCDTEPGSSGSPLLDRHHQVVGVHRAGACTAGGGENFAVSMRGILPLLPSSETTLALSGGKLLLGTGFVTLRGRVVLGRATSEVDPLTQAVNLTLADASGSFYSVDIPAGSFRGEPRDAIFTDQTGKLAAGVRFFHLTQQAPGALRVAITARGSDLSGLVGDTITITLAIGEARASQTVRFRRRAVGLLYP